MNITKIIDLKNNGVLIKTDKQHLYAGCDGTIYKYHLDEMNLISSLALFNAKKTNKYSTVYFSIFEHTMSGKVHFTMLYFIIVKDMNFMQIGRKCKRRKMCTAMN
ncbi:MAG: hypothetical protein LBD23_04845 [Oscillospiraceae bacterium]|jgi:hypothetical protein|nr:hypothetical protein [Oscillospiraceae bacterium]